MLVIRRAQLETLAQATRNRFEEEMVAHLKTFAPGQAAAAGEGGLRRLIRAGMERAGRYGFTLRGPVRLYLELMIVFGHEFDTDPLLAWAKRELRAGTGGELARADRLHAIALQYYAAVVGPNAEFKRRALRRLLREPVAQWLSGDLSDPGVEAKLRSVHPEKCAAAGPEALPRVIAVARRRAREHGLPEASGGPLIAALLVGLGHGCLGDPVCPWLAASLRETDGLAGNQRADKLATRALAFASTVLAAHEGG
jgi:hypothetical protein